MKYFVTSDIHGFYTPFISALNEAGFDENDDNSKLIICGDLLDRGDEAVAVQDYILRLLRKDMVVLIKGNHESLIEAIQRELRSAFPFDGTFPQPRPNTLSGRQRDVASLFALK